MPKEDYQYDVALSFAGENREYVEDVAEHLRAAGVRIFYDRYKEVELWGKDLYAHLDEIYRRRARYCVMFISEAYARKAWTNHERESVQARAFQDNEEYILPARFDDTEIPGVRPTTGYVDLRAKSPAELAGLIVGKLKGEKVQGRAKNEKPSFRRPKPQGRGFNPYDISLRFMDELTNELKRRCDALSGDGVSATVFDRQGKKCLRVVLDGETVYSLDVWMGGFGDSTINFYGGRGQLQSYSNSTNAWANFHWSRDRGQPVLNVQDLSLLGHMPEERPFSIDDFIDAVWNKVCETLERA